MVVYAFAGAATLVASGGMFCHVRGKQWGHDGYNLNDGACDNFTGPRRPSLSWWSCCGNGSPNCKMNHSDMFATQVRLW